MYNFSLAHVQALKLHCFEANLSMPELFRFASQQELQACYNGIGPDRWSSCFRRFTTWILTFLEASALIHDWEFTYQPKTYGAFTLANLRLAYNSAKDKHPVAGLAAAILCQLFGWRGYKGGGDRDAGNRTFPDLFSGLPLFCDRKPVSQCGLLCGSFLCLMLIGCFSDSKERICEFDAAGTLIREEIRSESPVKSILASVGDKTIILWDNSWIAFVSASSFSLEDPAPVFKMGIGHADKGYISLLPQHDFSSVPETVRTVRAGALTVSASGLNVSQPRAADEVSGQQKP